MGTYAPVISMMLLDYGSFLEAPGFSPSQHGRRLELGTVTVHDIYYASLLPFFRFNLGRI